MTITIPANRVIPLGQDPNGFASLAVARGASPAAGSPLVRFDFANGDTMTSPSINEIGFYWDGTRTIQMSPAGVLGMLFRFGPDGPVDDSWVEQKYELNSQHFEVYERFTLETPANFRTRIITVITMVDITQTAGWQIGDSLTYGINYLGEQSGAIFKGTNGNNIYLLNADRLGLSSPWMGVTITNTTRGTTADSATSANQEAGSGRTLFNNKFHALYGGDYSQSGTSVFEYSTSYSGHTNIDGNVVTHQFGQTDTHGTQGNVPSDGPDLQLLKAGETHEYTLRRKKSSAQGVADAIAELWEDGVLIYYNRDGLNYDTQINYYERGYLLGYSNSGFEEQTDFYISKYEFYGANRPGGLE